MCTACNCSSETNPSTTQDVEISAPSAEPTSYTVTGMTCGHCVASVTEEVDAIHGVRDVVVDLATGKLTFNADQPVSADAVEAAVREAGYALV